MTMKMTATADMPVQEQGVTHDDFLIADSIHHTPM
jgi:hypothetical protein